MNNTKVKNILFLVIATFAISILFQNCAEPLNPELFKSDQSSLSETDKTEEAQNGVIKVTTATIPIEPTFNEDITFVINASGGSGTYKYTIRKGSEILSQGPNNRVIARVATVDELDDFTVEVDDGVNTPVTERIKVTATVYDGGGNPVQYNPEVDPNDYSTWPECTNPEESDPDRNGKGRNPDGGLCKVQEYLDLADSTVGTINEDALEEVLSYNCHGIRGKLHMTKELSEAELSRLYRLVGGTHSRGCTKSEGIYVNQMTMPLRAKAWTNLESCGNCLEASLFHKGDIMRVEVHEPGGVKQSLIDDGFTLIHRGVFYSPRTKTAELVSLYPFDSRNLGYRLYTIGEEDRKRFQQNSFVWIEGSPSIYLVPIGRLSLFE